MAKRANRLVDRWILVIADDLTGALECGAKFAAQGMTACVTTGTVSAVRPNGEILVIDTETRHRSAEDAALIVGEAARRGREFAPWLIYKKTDSTLRGNIASELRALLDAFPGRPLIYAPAYPQMGRTVRGGELFVEGVPLHETPFAHDPLNPARESRLRELLKGIPVEILDGECDADVEAAAHGITTARTPMLAAGPAALAGALAASLRPSAPSPPPWPLLPRCLVVNGSLHPASLEQVEYARQHGCIGGEWTLHDDEVEAAGLERASRTGESVRRCIQAAPVDALAVFGGDTAFGIHAALGAAPFESIGEILPGVPLSRCGELFWITKAGGFGKPDVLCDIRERLT